MKEFRVENSKIYSNSGLSEHNTHIFDIVDKIPLRFFIWNIGENMGSDEYIPLAEALHPENKDDYSINPYTLKAIKLDPEKVKLLRAAANVGINNRATAEKALKSKKKGYWSNRKREQAAKTIDIFNCISE